MHRFNDIKNKFLDANTKLKKFEFSIPRMHTNDVDSFHGDPPPLPVLADTDIDLINNRNRVTNNAMMEQIILT